MLVTAKQIQKLDKTAIERCGIPSLMLMENAGRAVAAQARRLLKGKRNVCVVCGAGNNAGDGFVAARHLAGGGCRVCVVLVTKADTLKHDAAANFRKLKKFKIPVIRLGTQRSASLREIKNADIVVDAIFGVGLNRPIAGIGAEAIASINQFAKKVLAVDVPSGLDATTGRICGACVKAHTTVTFTFAKKGFKKGEGPHFCGDIIVVDIGIPKSLHKHCR